MADEISKLVEPALKKLETADTLELIDEIRVELLGRKGKLNEISKTFGKLSPEERAQLGKELNAANVWPTIWREIAVGVLNGLAFALVILRPMYRQVPIEIEEASRVDGCNTFQTFWRIVLPIMRVPLIVVGVLSFVQAYGQFVYPLTLLSKQELQPATVGIGSGVIRPPAVSSSAAPSGLSARRDTSAFWLVVWIPRVSSRRLPKSSRPIEFLRCRSLENLETATRIQTSPMWKSSAVISA